MADSNLKVKMNLDDVCTIETVFANLDLDYKLTINTAELTESLKRIEYINDDDRTALVSQYEYVVKPEESSAGKIIRFNTFLWHIVSFLSFTQLVSVFEEAGYIHVCELLCKSKGIVFCTIQEGRSTAGCVCKRVSVEIDISSEDKYLLVRTVPRAVPKRQLNHDESVRKYYIKLKVLADNNGFELGTRVELNQKIERLTLLIGQCKSLSRKQYLIDKHAVTFLLLTQQYANCSERNKVLKRLHDSMPHGSDVDRTIYEAIFHSFKAINWATKGNYQTAAKHIQIARDACATCLSPLPSVVANTGALIMRNEENLHCYSQNPDCQGGQDYIFALQLANNLTEEERSVWVNIIMIRRASSLLGFDLFSKLNDNKESPDSETIEQARNILTKLRQSHLPLQNRQTLVLYLCLGRLHDLDCDKDIAVKYIKKALSLAENGTFDIVERANINDYLSRLSQTKKLQ